MAELAMLVDSGVGSNLQVGGTMPARNFFDGPPLFSCAPTVGGTTNVCYRLLKCPLVSALQSAHLLVKSGEGQYK